MCSVPTGEADEVDIATRGTITTFSVITPLQYQGQEETEDYVQATILLDGSHSTLGMQRILDLAIAEVRTGLRVEAVWRPEAERKLQRRRRAQPRARRSHLRLEADRRARRADSSSTPTTSSDQARALKPMR